MALTVPQVARLARDAGFTGEGIVIITAIAIRESGLDPGAMGDNNNPSPGCHSYGLVQINVCPSAGNKGVWYRENPTMLLDGGNNMRAAFDLSNHGTNWGPWGMGANAYRSGVAAPPIERVRAELAGVNLDTVQVPAGSGGAPPTSGTAAGASSGSSGVLGGLEQLGAVLTDPHTWLRVLYVLGGAGLIIAGLAILNADTIGGLAGSLTKGAGSGNIGKSVARGAVDDAIGDQDNAQDHDH